MDITENPESTAAPRSAGGDQPAGQCGCADFTMSRRNLLRTAAIGTGALAVSGTFGGAFREVAYGAAPGGNVLVVLSLRGGADGLSMVVPRGADHALLQSARPRTVVPKASLIGGDGAFGLHPAFAPLLPMWQQGSFGAVHAVGLPAPNRSHFSAIQAIEDSDPGTSARIGWINRMVGLDRTAPVQSAVQLGTALLPTSLTGPAGALGVAGIADLDIVPLGTSSRRRRASLRRMWTHDRSALGNAVRGTTATAHQLSSLSSSASRTVHTSRYPKGELREVLANTAALIRADVGTKVVTIDYGDWDMHVGMIDSDRDPSKGWMHKQVSHLAQSLAAFFVDLEGTASRVTVVTVSEFGRRVTENASRGLDHGYGNVMLLLGAGVRGGQVYGNWPHLDALESGDLAVRQDFRSVMWEVLTNRFPDVSGRRANIFPGLTPETIGAMA